MDEFMIQFPISPFFRLRLSVRRSVGKALASHLKGFAFAHNGRPVTVIYIEPIDLYSVAKFYFNCLYSFSIIT